MIFKSFSDLALSRGLTPSKPVQPVKLRVRVVTPVGRDLGFLIKSEAEIRALKQGGYRVERF